MTCEQGLLRLLWGGGRSWSATALVLAPDSLPVYELDNIHHKYEAEIYK